MIPQEQPQKFSTPEITAREGDQLPSGDTELDNFVHTLQAHLNALRRHQGSDADKRTEWDHFIREHEPHFLRMIRSHHWPADECEDRVQDLCVALVVALKSFHFEPGRGSFEDWISVVVRHRLVDSDRSRKSRPVLRFGCLKADELPGREPDPVNALEQKDLQELVRDALDELRAQVTARDYEAFRLRWIEGLCVKEIAARLEMTEGQIWSSNHRAQEKLRPLLQRRLDPGD